VPNEKPTDGGLSNCFRASLCKPVLVWTYTKKFSHLAMPLEQWTCKPADEIEQLVAVMRPDQQTRIVGGVQSRMNTNEKWNDAICASTIRVHWCSSVV
jgi:hypothetical protein